MMDSRKPDSGSDGWDEYVRRAEDLISSGNLDRWENDYKRDLSCNLRQARIELLDGSDRWASLVDKGLSTNLTFFRHRTNFRKWMANSSNEASEALRAIWTKDDLPVEQRICEFCNRFPLMSWSRGAGTRMNIASVLLMGLDVERYPPFRIQISKTLFECTGYDPFGGGAEEAVLYGHFLGFLDKFIEESRAHGVHLRHRLDAQGVTWQSQRGKQPFALPRLGSQPARTQPQSRQPPCDLQDLANELLLPPNFLEKINALLEDKRQVIFQGPPGTGKTYVAQKLADCLARDEDHVTLVQFHPSYSYEDFVRGFRPTLKEGLAGFTLQDGPLLRAADKASKEENTKHFLIIDEINRGNLAKVFGELYFLLEYRDKSIRMQYQHEGEESFSLPKNLYIIGTMNTADRSIALVDLALRRRFYFVEFHPDNDPVKGVLRKWLREGSEFEWVADVVEEANRQLEDYKHAAIGPSYFMKDGLDKMMVERVWEHNVLPYVEELLFGNNTKIQQLQLERLCEKVAPYIRWSNGDEQDGDKTISNSKVVNDATDQPTGVPGEHSNPS